MNIVYAWLLKKLKMKVSEIRPKVHKTFDLMLMPRVFSSQWSENHPPNRSHKTVNWVTLWKKKKHFLFAKAICEWTWTGRLHHE